MLTQSKFTLSLIVLTIAPSLATRDTEPVSCTQLAELSRGMLGAFVPQCEEDGTFSATQCHGSIGHCWCSTSTGEEIIGSRTGPLDNRFDCLNLPECLVRSHEAQTHRMHGTFVPQCEADGSYKLEQCHSSTGHCWCVSEDGEEVSGTRRRFGSTEERIDCWNLPECLGSAHAIRQRHLLGAFVPQCESDGTFSSRQCHSSTGYCWCVDSSSGLEISGTRRGATESQIQCGEKMPLCLQMAYEVTQRSSGMMIGAYVPQCDENGRFSAQQCHGSTGHCWCVTPTAEEFDEQTNSFVGEGVEVIGTRRGPTEQRMDCSALPKCLLDAHTARLGATVPETSMVVIGAHIPQCDADGFFAIQQCRRSTGYCWCVSREDGHEISGTRRAPSDERGQMNCEQIPACLAEADNAIAAVGGVAMPGTFVPQCTENGDYQKRQCHASSGHCWCVDVSGRKIVGTVRSPTQPQFETCETEEIPECVRAVHEATVGTSSSAVALVGRFVPQCQADGSFSSKQCHGSTGHCWCVDTHGREIEGTRSRPDDERRTSGAMKCGSAVPECLKQAHEARMRKQAKETEAAESSNGHMMMVGVYIPQCDADGSFSSTQCHGSTGHCWCVDEKGVELLGSRRTASESRPDCTRRVLSKCQLEARRAQETHVIGMFVPACEANGDYRSKQCHGSTGHCWCADVNGDEVLGTRSTPHHATPITDDCDHLHTCLVTAHNRRHQGSLMGAYIPQCDSEDGSYSTVQCHTSTGYCWCTTPSGVEIPNTRVRFEAPQCPSQVNLDLTGAEAEEEVLVVLPSSSAATTTSDDETVVTEEAKQSTSNGSSDSWGPHGAIAIGVVAGVVGSVIAVAVMIVMRKRSSPILTGPYAPLTGHNQA